MLNLTRAACLTVLLLTSYAVIGCAGAPTPTPTQMAISATQPDFCATALPIYISKDDKISDDTARQILKHNLTGRKLCNW
jgi:hypothetical protein